MLVLIYARIKLKFIPNGKLSNLDCTYSYTSFLYLFFFLTCGLESIFNIDIYLSLYHKKYVPLCCIQLSSDDDSNVDQWKDINSTMSKRRLIVQSKKYNNGFHN